MPRTGKRPAASSGPKDADAGWFGVSGLFVTKQLGVSGLFVTKPGGLGLASFPTTLSDEPLVWL